MKPLNKYLFLLVLTACCSCSMDKNYMDNIIADAKEYTAIVTVKWSPAGVVYFQADEQTRLLPAGDPEVYKGLERIICGVRIHEFSNPDLEYLADVLWFEALDKGTMTSDTGVSGTDPVWVLSDWMTSCEDGYLTLHYEAWWGQRTDPHAFYLVTGLNPEDPYEVWLRHDARGDGHQQKADSLVYFDLQSLPDTGGQYVTLTLKWTNGEGQVAERQFPFRSR